MICENYADLTIVQKREFIGKITHLIANDSRCFGIAQLMIDVCSSKGMLEGIQILHKENEAELPEGYVIKTLAFSIFPSLLFENREIFCESEREKLIEKAWEHKKLRESIRL